MIDAHRIGALVELISAVIEIKPMNFGSIVRARIDTFNQPAVSVSSFRPRRVTIWAEKFDPSYQ